MTQIMGHYNPQTFQYEPPPGYTNWNEVIQRQKIRLDVAASLNRFPPE
jgi:hypothetical protein